jgi:hypothetical protein
VCTAFEVWHTSTRTGRVRMAKRLQQHRSKASVITDSQCLDASDLSVAGPREVPYLIVAPSLSSAGNGRHSTTHSTVSPECEASDHRKYMAESPVLVGRTCFVSKPLLALGCVKPCYLGYSKIW